MSRQEIRLREDLFEMRENLDRFEEEEDEDLLQHRLLLGFLGLSLVFGVGSCLALCVRGRLGQWLKESEFRS